MKLASYLSANGISVAQFAAQIGVSSTSVHRYLAGERVPKRQLMIKIREKTGGEVTADDFFDVAEAAA